MQLNRYVEMTNRIRELSSPLLESISNAEEYRVRLLENFRKIGDIARSNNTILDEIYYPLLDTEIPLPDEVVEDMRDFADAMINAYTLENLDLPMMYKQAGKMLADAKAKGETAGIIRALDEFITAAYAMTNITVRLLPYFDVGLQYRKEGIQAAQEIISYLEPERFLTLPDAASRESVLIISRYIAAFFGAPMEDETTQDRQHNLDMLKRSLALCDDPFYREHAPEYDWDYHRFRALEYISRQSECNNLHAYDREQLLYIRDISLAFATFMDIHRERFSQYVSDRMMTLSSLRNDYLCGMTPLETYKRQLRDLMEQDAEDPSLTNRLNQYFVIPVEYIRVLDPDHLSEDEKSYLASFYKRIIVAMHQLRKKSISYMLSYVSDVLSDFIEVEGGMTFEDMALSLMVALHPPTYVHTLSVSDFAACIASHAIERMPECFIGFMGLKTAEEVLSRREEILDFTLHAARCHDVGKLFITETIIMYGRTLYRSEFELIRAHPEIGGRQLEKHASTRKYAPIALGHHRWYDDSNGYPPDFRLQDCEDRTVIDIVTVADCMDAATDAVGRSYKDGKTLDDFLEELRAGSGTRYAPYLVELLSVPEVKEDLDRLLVTCRDENYRKAFHLLEELERQEA